VRSHCHIECQHVFAILYTQHLLTEPYVPGAVLLIFIEICKLDDAMYLSYSDPVRIHSSIQSDSSHGSDITQAINITDIKIMIQPVHSFERAINGRSLMSFFPTPVQPYSTENLELVNMDTLVNPPYPQTNASGSQRLGKFFYTLLSDCHLMHDLQLKFKHERLTDDSNRYKQPIRRAMRFTMRLADEFERSDYPYSAPLAFAPGVNLDVLTE
jgi:hypothetical protein